jgi:hypothetical protein
MTDPRTKIAEQLGMLIIANIEQAAHIDSLTAQLQQAQQRLHEATADAQGPSGAVPAPDKLGGS